MLALSIASSGKLKRPVRLTERTALAGQTRELDLEQDASAVGAGHCIDGALHISSAGESVRVESSVGQSRRVHSSSRIVGDDGGISKSLTWSRSMGGRILTAR